MNLLNTVQDWIVIITAMVGLLAWFIRLETKYLNIEKMTDNLELRVTLVEKSNTDIQGDIKAIRADISWIRQALGK